MIETNQGTYYQPCLHDFASVHNVSKPKGLHHSSLGTPLHCLDSKLLLSHLAFLYHSTNPPYNPNLTSMPKHIKYRPIYQLIFRGAVFSQATTLILTSSSCSLISSRMTSDGAASVTSSNRLPGNPQRSRQSDDPSFANVTDPGSPLFTKKSVIYIRTYEVGGPFFTPVCIFNCMYSTQLSGRPPRCSPKIEHLLWNVYNCRVKVFLGPIHIACLPSSNEDMGSKGRRLGKL